jgi:CDP-glucose 4,6-dehydratase
VEQIASRFIHEWGEGRLERSPDSAEAPHEAHFLHLAIDKARSELVWEPILDGKEAIEWTVRWYKSWHRSKGDLTPLSVGQLRDFVALAREQRAIWAR